MSGDPQGDHAEDRAAGGRLERLRGFRVRGERDQTVAAEVERLRRGVRKRTRAEEAVGEAWAAVVPDEFAGACMFVELKGKTAIVRARDAGVRYRIERWLSAGGLATLAGVARAPVGRVKVVV